MNCDAVNNVSIPIAVVSYMRFCYPKNSIQKISNSIKWSNIFKSKNIATHLLKNHVERKHVVFIFIWINVKGGSCITNCACSQCLQKPEKKIRRHECLNKKKNSKW